MALSDTELELEGTELLPARHVLSSMGSPLGGLTGGQGGGLLGPVKGALLDPLKSKGGPLGLGSTKDSVMSVVQDGLPLFQNLGK